ncbi:uncharacterized protein A4U43_C10F14770 [Asparagus officinalis]|uniref:Uncharacterized protein n=1 Tax=Asparagus officinalis TaxID=4686 RepID=A0A5P1E7K6_ASPOF|nr:uncharacterized protein A4U43_C10F14770 [Asparagus officinalis]
MAFTVVTTIPAKCNRARIIEEIQGRSAVTWSRSWGRSRWLDCYDEGGRSTVTGSRSWGRSRGLYYVDGGRRSAVTGTPELGEGSVGGDEDGFGGRPTEGGAGCSREAESTPPPTSPVVASPCSTSDPSPSATPPKHAQSSSVTPTLSLTPSPRLAP